MNQYINDAIDFNGSPIVKHVND